MDLNDLLKGAMIQAAASEAAKGARAKLKDRRLVDKERDLIADKLREWESTADYRDVQLVWRCERVTCRHCEGITLGRGQVLIEQHHLRIANTRRWIEAKLPYSDTLPRRQQYVESKVDICQHCVHGQGFV